jgi:beta-lactamase regulating signal transducer with metallopeptidase domain
MMDMLSIVAKATALVAVALVVVLHSMRHASASTRHLILGSVFAALLALPLAEFLVPEITVPVGRPGGRPLLSLPITVGAIAGEAPIGPATSVSSSAVDRQRAETIAPLALVLTGWAAGAVLCLVPVLLTPWRLRQLRRTARLCNRARTLVRSLGARRAVTVLVHDAVSAPMTCGIMRPVVVLPADAPRWSDRDKRRALVHELEHIHRADWPVHMATRIVCALYWFHPLVWMAWRRLALEAERACDDAVLRAGESTAYAQQLVTLARRQVSRSAIPALSMAGHSDLSARVAAVLDDTQARGSLTLTRAAIAVAGAVMLATAVGARPGGPRRPK